LIFFPLLPVIRSEKVQERHNLRIDENRLAIVEKTCEQIQTEVAAEDNIRKQQYREKQKSLSAVRLSEIEDAEELSDLLEFGNDPDAVEAALTCAQKKLVIDYQAVTKAQKDADISERVRAKLAEVFDMERQVTPLLKLRVCDALKPDKNALLSIWRPSNDNRAMFREGSCLKMSNVAANAMRYNVAQLTVGSLTKFEVINSERFVRRPEMQRQLTPIAAVTGGEFTPFANEFDTIGVVVKIGEMSKFQLVYLADADSNLLIVNFWGGIKKFAYDDTVRLREVLYAKNLQWRPSDKSLHGVPKSYTNESTTFSQRPANAEASAAITELTTALSNIGIEDFVKRCVETIDEAERRTSQRNSSFLSRTPTPLSSTSANQLSFEGNVTSQSVSPADSQARARAREKIECLSQIPSPPRVPTFELTWNSNYRRRKVPSRRPTNENQKD
jgi:BRCA2, oligonucleotide/oligosaccharide-binding, domain 3